MLKGSALIIEEAFNEITTRHGWEAPVYSPEHEAQRYHASRPDSPAGLMFAQAWI